MLVVRVEFFFVGEVWFDLLWFLLKRVVVNEFIWFGVFVIVFGVFENWVDYLWVVVVVIFVDVDIVIC